MTPGASRVGSGTGPATTAAPWQWAVLLGFLAGGVIAIITVLRWRRSDVRTELLDDLHERVAAAPTRGSRRGVPVVARGVGRRAIRRGAPRHRRRIARRGRTPGTEPRATSVPARQRERVTARLRAASRALAPDPLRCSAASGDASPVPVPDLVAGLPDPHVSRAGSARASAVTGPA